MKIKGNLAKRLLIYVFSLFMLSLYTTSCASYDEDIDDIYTQLEELKSQIAEIKNQIETGNYIVSVQTISNGIRIVFNSGNSYDIVNGQDGTNGTHGTQWAIGVDSIWYKDGVKTNPPLRAIGEEGKQGETSPAPEIYKESDTEYYWVVFKWEDTENDFVADTLWNEPIYSYNTYVVDRDTYYELYVWVKDETTPSNSKYDKLILPKNTVNPEFYILEFLGYENIKTPSRPISLESIKDDIEFFYWHLPRIYNATAGKDTIKWEGRTTVEKNQVLTTLKRDSVAAIIQTNLSKSSWKLTLKDSQGGLLPISFESPVKHTGNLTKAAADSIYIVQMNGTKDKYTDAEEYASQFKVADGLGVVYTLIDTITGTNSGYKAFISPKKGDNSLATATISTIGGGNSLTGEYEVNKDTNLGIGFANSAYLYDYYVEPADSTQAVDKFGFTTNKATGTFRVTKAEEEKFKLIVYKLHYNGYFYADTVSIKPL